MKCERLLMTRKDRTLTQAQVAELAGIEPQNYSKYERGTANPGLPIFERLCVALQVSASYLLGLTDSPAAVYPLTVNDELTADEAHLLSNYRACTDDWKANIAAIARTAAQGR